MNRFKQQWSKREERKNKGLPSSDEEKYLIEKSKQNRNRIIFLLVITIYALLAVLGTTDEDIFLLSPIQIPFIKIFLPLENFYIIMPIFILVLHFNAIHMIGINKKSILQLNELNEKLPASIFDNIYKENNFLGFLIQVIVYLFPFFVLCTFLYRFSDYQDIRYTFFHFFLVILDFLILLKIKDKKVIFIAFLSISLGIYYVWNVYLFLNGKEEKVNLLFPPRLVVVNTNLNRNLDLALLKEYAKEEGSTKPLSFLTPRKMRNRNFLYADFSYSKMYRFDFSNSNLSYANFRYAKLPYSIFDNTIAVESDFSNSFLFSSKIQEMNATNTWFMNTNLAQSYIASSTFINSDLTRINFSKSYINGNFSKSILKRSNFMHSHVSGNFNDVNLEDADFSSSNIGVISFKKAFLANTKFVGSIIFGLDIRGAFLYKTNFIGAVGKNSMSIFKVIKTYPSRKFMLYEHPLEKRLNIETNLTQVFDLYESTKKFEFNCSISFLYTKYLKKYKVDSMEICKNAIGKNSVEWFEFNKEKIITGELTQEMIDRINSHP